MAERMQEADRSASAWPMPTEVPHVEVQGRRVITGASESVYPLTAIPEHVIRDMFSSWPEGVPHPANLSKFEFALRRTGRGNHPWLIKFRDAPAIRIAYGGHAKPVATVRADGEFEFPGATMTAAR